MNYELKEALSQIAERMPLSDELSSKLKTLNSFDFIRSCFFLDGRELSDRIILKLIKNEYTNEAVLLDYENIKKYKALYSEIWTMIRMELDLDKKQICRFFAILTDTKKEDFKFREDNEKIENLAFTPPDFREIEKRIEAFFLKEYRTDFRGDIIEEAAFVHNGLISIYPFKEKMELVAFAAMQFTLLKKKFFIIPFMNAGYFQALYTDLQEKNMVYIYEETIKSAIQKAKAITEFIDEENLE
jgi:hypothetical protein